MEDAQLNALWKQYDQKLEEARLLNLQSWALNLQNFEYQQRQKVKSKLNKLIGLKLFAVVLGIVYALTLFVLVTNSLQWNKIFFVISASVIAVITSIAVVVYLRQVGIIANISQTDSIVAAQEKISKLQAGTLQVTRILFLQAPFYCTWFITPQMIASDPTAFLFITLPVFLFFCWLSWFLYKNIHFNNIHKKWFRILFNNPEWVSLVKSAKFLEEVEDFKKELVVT